MDIHHYNIQLYDSLCSDLRFLIQSFLLPNHYYALRAAIKSEDSCLVLDSDRFVLVNTELFNIERKQDFNLHRYYVTSSGLNRSKMIQSLLKNYRNTVYEKYLVIINYFRTALTDIEYSKVYNHVMEGESVSGLASFAYLLEHEVRIDTRKFNGRLSTPSFLWMNVVRNR